MRLFGMFCFVVLVISVGMAIFGEQAGILLVIVVIHLVVEGVQDQRHIAAVFAPGQVNIVRHFQIHRIFIQRKGLMRVLCWIAPE